MSGEQVLSMQGLKRSHYCCDIDESMIGREVVVMGWVNKRRDLGRLIFIALRDRTGLLQVTIDGNKSAPEMFKTAETIRAEYILAVSGIVAARTEENINPAMKTGKIEIDAKSIRILSEAETPPFMVTDSGVGNDLRLKYRYIDLRRPELQTNLYTRHKIAYSVREFLNAEGFIEIETPVLTKSTPEGARDYLVPSRLHPGSFYALPQSPQIFKQLLMVSGFDKYFQIVKCFRDEDLRADRQPEFTQIDMELSFVDIEDVIDVNERLMAKVMADIHPELEISIPFPRMTYAEAMNRYGSDKPDTRFGMEICDITDIVKDGGFKAFNDIADSGGSIRGINAVGCAGFSRRQIDALAEFVKENGGLKGMSWIAVTEGGLKTSLSKFFDEHKLNEIVSRFGAVNGDLILICAGSNNVLLEALGALRLELAKKLELTRDKSFNFLWVTEFPLLEWSPEDKRFYAKHHPFTAPMDEDEALLTTNPENVRAKAYDLVLNGTELGGGSIRIHRRDLQEKIFATLGFSKQEANERFGFMMDAFKYGAPPHGGLAFGLDRIAMLLTFSESLRDVIAFPKVKDASCPMTDAPGTVDDKQLDELGIMIALKKD